MLPNYKPNERIVDRAIELWKRMLRNPKYDALGEGPASDKERFTMGMASAMASMLPNNVTPERLEEFGKHLKRALMECDDRGFYHTSLHVDYGADRLLQQASDAAGMKVAFPWKTNMWLDTDRLSVRYGYGAETVYHYPLPDGRWLVTTLSGSDISKVLDYVQGGRPEFTIES